MNTYIFLRFSSTLSHRSTEGAGSRNAMVLFAFGFTGVLILKVTVLFALGFIGVLHVKGISLREKLVIGLSWLTASLPAETSGFVFGSDSQVFSVPSPCDVV
jgi:hypothetical protein